MKLPTLFALTVIAAALAACGGATPPPTSPDAPGAPQAGAPTAWADTLSMDQKRAFMKAVVSPRLAKVFQGANPKRYASFDCKSCHGPNWAAPKDVLPKLMMKGGKITAFEEKPEVSKFMAEQVVPAMASAMGKPPYDPVTHQGFGCGGCHAVAMQ